MVGTPYYIAPEIITGTYSKECDLWSLGVTIFLMLSGDIPFKGDSVAEVMKNINEETLKLEGEMWEFISAEGRNLVEQLLQKDPSQRITSAQALQHDWFSELSTDSLDDLDLTIMMRLKGYRGISFLKK